MNLLSIILSKNQKIINNILIAHLIVLQITNNHIIWQLKKKKFTINLQLENQKIIHKSDNNNNKDKILLKINKIITNKWKKYFIVLQIKDFIATKKIKIFKNH